MWCKLCLGLPILLLLTHSCYASPNSDLPLLRLGAIQSLTGVGAPDGENVARGIRLAVEEINSTGKKVELFLEDDLTAPHSALGAYQALKRRQVDAVIGATWAFVTDALIPRAARDGLVLLNTTVIPEGLRLDLGRGYAFANYIPVAAETRPCSDFLEERGVKRLGVVYNRTPWAFVQAEMYRKRAMESGYEVVEYIETLDVENNSMRELIPRLVAKRVDGIVLIVAKNDTDLFLRRAAELKLAIPICSSKNTPYSFEDTTQKAAYRGVCFGYPVQRLSSEQSFYRKFTKRFGEPPRIYADNSYDAAFLIYKAFKESKALGISLKDALRQIRHRGVNTDYVFSPVTSLARGSSTLVCMQQLPGGEIGAEYTRRQ